MPDVLIADVDIPEHPNMPVATEIILGFASLVFCFFIWRNFGMAWGAIATLAFFGFVKIMLFFREQKKKNIRERMFSEAPERIREFISNKSGWKIRLYRSPNGFRAIVMHRLFSVDDPETEEFFSFIGTDPIYVTMCKRQKCFRARVSPKPWRIGMSRRLKRKHGLWATEQGDIEYRKAWVEEYESMSEGYSACRIVEDMGDGKTDAEIMSRVEVHDMISGALSQRPIA